MVNVRKFQNHPELFTDKKFLQKSWYAPLNLKFFETAKIRKHQILPLRLFSALWDNFSEISLWYPHPPQYMNFSVTRNNSSHKSSLYENFQLCEAKHFLESLWTRSMVYSNFRTRPKGSIDFELFSAGLKYCEWRA